MSLIKCPKCGHAVPDTSDVCQFCGYEIFPSQAAESKASSRVYSEDELAAKATPADAPKDPAPPKKRKRGRIIAIILIVILAICALAYFFFVRNRDMIDESYSDISVYEEDVIEDDSNGDYTEDNGQTTDDNGTVYYDEDENGGTEDNGAVMSEDVTDDEVGD